MKKTRPGITMIMKMRIILNNPGGEILSKYTTELRFICETEAGFDASKGYNDINQAIQTAIPKIFNFDFPIFDENYRNVLETKILKHYYTQEIGLETYGLWKLKLDTKLNEIMPYYNQLYESATLDFNPLYDVDYTDTRTGGNTQTSQNTKSTTGNQTSNSEDNGTGSNTTTTETTTESSGTDKYSDTPQGTINDVNVTSNAYLSNVRALNSNDSSDTSVTNNYTDNRDRNETIQRNENVSDNGTLQTTEEYVNVVKGKRGGQSYASMINEYRNTMLNIDLMVLNELSELFMNLW